MKITKLSKKHVLKVQINIKIVKNALKNVFI